MKIAKSFFLQKLYIYPKESLSDMLPEIIIGMLVVPVFLTIILFDRGLGLGLSLNLTDSWILVPIVSSFLPVVILFSLLAIYYESNNHFDKQLRLISKIIVLVSVLIPLSATYIFLTGRNLLFFLGWIPIYLTILLLLWSIKFDNIHQLQLRRYLIVSLIWPIISAAVLIVSNLIVIAIPLYTLSYTRLSFAFFFNSIPIGFIPFTLQLKMYRDIHTQKSTIKDNRQIKIDEIVNLIYFIFIISMSSFFLFSTIYFITDQLTETGVQLRILHDIGILAIPLGIYLTFILIASVTEEDSGFPKKFRRTAKLIAVNLSALIFLNIIIVFILDISYFLFFSSLGMVYIIVQLVIQSYRLPAKLENEIILKRLLLGSIAAIFIIPLSAIIIAEQIKEIIFTRGNQYDFIENIILMILPGMFLLLLRNYKNYIHNQKLGFEVNQRRFDVLYRRNEFIP